MFRFQSLYLCRHRAWSTQSFICMSIKRVRIFLRKNQKRKKSHLFENEPVFYCRDLPNKGLGKIDPYVKISSESNVKISSDKTKTLDNNVNPTYYDDVLELDYSNLLDQINFKVMDDDIGKDDSIGECNIAVGKLLMSEGLNSFGYHRIELSKGGFLFVQAKHQFEMEQTVAFSVAATGLPKMDTFGKSDPYYQILLIDGKDGEMPEYLQIFSSETEKKTLSPNWGESKLQMFRLGEHGLANKVIFKVFDWNNRGKDDYRLKN